MKPMYAALVLVVCSTTAFAQGTGGPVVVDEPVTLSGLEVIAKFASDGGAKAKQSGTTDTDGGVISSGTGFGSKSRSASTGDMRGSLRARASSKTRVSGGGAGIVVDVSTSASGSDRGTTAATPTGEAGSTTSGNAFGSVSFSVTVKNKATTGRKFRVKGVTHARAHKNNGNLMKVNSSGSASISGALSASSSATSDPIGKYVHDPDSQTIDVTLCPGESISFSMTIKSYAHVSGTNNISSASGDATLTISSIVVIDCSDDPGDGPDIDVVEVK